MTLLPGRDVIAEGAVLFDDCAIPPRPKRRPISYRFFDKDMLACCHCLYAKLGMTGWGSGDDDRINVRQGIFVVSVYGNAVIHSRLSIIDSGKPLIHTDDCRYSGRRPQDAQMLGTPVTYSDDPHSNSVWLHSHSTSPLSRSSGLGAFLEPSASEV